MSQLALIEAPNEIVLAEHAAVIKALGKRKIEAQKLIELLKRGLITAEEAERRMAEMYQ